MQLNIEVNIPPNLLLEKPVHEESKINDVDSRTTFNLTNPHYDQLKYSRKEFLDALSHERKTEFTNPNFLHK